MIAAVVLIALLSHEVVGQVLKNRTSMGFFLRPALTQGVVTNGLSVLDDPTFLAAGLGAYALIRVKTEPGKVPFYFLRAEAGLSNRAGIFEVEGFGPVRITSNIVDVSMIVPLTIEVTESLRANVGLGGSLGYLVNSKVESDSGIPPTVSQATLRSGLIVDVGFLVDAKTTALFGLRALVEGVDYGYAEIGLYLGFGIPQKVK